MVKKNPKVFVAMSGGVDSSVAAALLKRDGFSVVGVYMKCWIATDPLYQGCTSVDDERSARLAAAHLKIPFYTWNFIKEYKKRVVEYMLEGYGKGITPNPDIMCNKEIKFGLFFDKAMKLGADFIATGHYARLERGKLLQAKDKNKDQSYFLSFIKPEVLSRTLFPIGNYTKPEVREMARKLGLPNAERKDSQGICFIGKVDFNEFLKQHIISDPGEIVDTVGTVLGKHDGLALYTIGQRKGIGLSGGPYYVVRKDFEKNRLIVSKNEKDLQANELLLSNVNWFEKPESFPMENIQARIRYRQPTSKASVVPVEGEKGLYRLVFSEPQRAVTAGQFVVLYKGEELLGGGVIG
ncbi:MAG: tRNA-specific 2-thiouridylase [Parcubacteria group bacterium Greene0714_21]|nr:MAG: tRNA-specific 2-thiouridylase [Parcubacteria group bacterium Greene0416_39]TSC97718.1 MAG: tRNA-specific 2-thiouridylase [Parcubacteria group bacterium Greene1014_47]TSD04359.1 MAG: tRNA-specific 2-thiouridylase [Parcubacteria group bacterium Greene0714_21]